MEKEMTELLLQIAQYRQTHPNISHLWHVYLKGKLKSMQNAINECKIALREIDRLDDLSSQDIISLYCMFDLESYRELT